MAHPKVFKEVLYIVMIICTTKITMQLCSTLRPDARTSDGSNPTNSNEGTGTSCSHSGTHTIQRLQELTSVENEECTTCTSRKANLTREELRQLRFEIVKMQILQKLQMTSPPCPSLPKPPLHPLLEAADMTDSDTNDEEGESGDFGSRTKSIVVYPNTGNMFCVDLQDYPCSRFQFLLPTEVGPSPSSAEIWLYKRNATESLKLTELVFSDSRETLISKRDLVFRRSDNYSRLVKFMLPASMLWTYVDNRVLDVQFSCYSGCEPGQFRPSVSVGNEEQPFLIVNSGLDKGSLRNRRSVNCVEGSTFCCRETLYISFSEIGWDNWILAPAGYDANFCKGKCFTDVSNTRFHHSTMLQRYIHMNNSAAEDIGLKMCCTPSKMSSLSILYRDENGTIIKANLPNMKAETCDCA